MFVFVVAAAATRVMIAKKMSAVDCNDKNELKINIIVNVEDLSFYLHVDRNNVTERMIISPIGSCSFIRGSWLQQSNDYKSVVFSPSHTGHETVSTISSQSRTCPTYIFFKPHVLHTQWTRLDRSAHTLSHTPNGWNESRYARLFGLLSPLPGVLIQMAFLPLDSK